MTRGGQQTRGGPATGPLALMKRRVASAETGSWRSRERSNNGTVNQRFVARARIRWLLATRSVPDTVVHMSKAFTRESDDLPDRPILARRSSPLPPGAKNYLTPDGARRLGEELERLLHVERSRLVAAPDAGDAQRQLQILNQRIHHLQQSLQSAVVVPPPAVREDRIRFGATVTVREQNGAESIYRIVGVDETDLDRCWISWLSPMARALLNASLGQHVRFKLPSGDTELEIVRFTYD